MVDEELGEPVEVKHSSVDSNDRGFDMLAYVPVRRSSGPI